MEKLFTAIGLMSGTSLDGMDAALVRTDGQQTTEYITDYYLKFDRSFALGLAAIAKGEAPLTEVLRLERQLTQKAVEAVQGLLQKARQKSGSNKTSELNVSGDAPVDVIGFHGQTLRHLPAEGLTFQMGDSSYLAEKTGIPVVGDFRRRDMAAGGEGAPLASYYHKAILAGHLEDKPQVVVNLGGVANITCFTPDGSIVAGDVGPGCGLLDKWMVQHFDQPYDIDGQKALAGRVDMKWISETLKKEPFFNQPLPKSADRYQFDTCWPEHLSPEDGAATLAALTTEAVAQAAHAVTPAEKGLWLTGGGAANQAMVRGFGKNFSPVRPIDDIGIPAEFLEAACFAWLAVRRLAGLPTSGPQTTGAEKQTTGGVLTV